MRTAGTDRTQLLFREVNTQIRALVREWNPAGGRFDFICECDDHECTATVSLQCSAFDALAAREGEFILSAACLDGRVRAV
jgi:hypothetical protein